MDTLNQNRNTHSGGPPSTLSGNGNRSLMIAPSMSSQFQNNPSSGLNGMSILSNATFGFGNSSSTTNSSLWSPNDLLDSVKSSSATTNASMMWPSSSTIATEMSLSGTSTTTALSSQPPCHIDTWKSPPGDSEQNNLWTTPQAPFATTSNSILSSATSSHFPPPVPLNDLAMSVTSSMDAGKKAPSSSTSGSVHESVTGSNNRVLSRNFRHSSSERAPTTRVEDLSPAEVAHRTEQQRKIDEIINNPSGWGNQSVDQSTEWDTSTLRDKSKDSGATSGAVGDSNVWCAGPPTGINVWEDYYESVGQNASRWNRMTLSSQGSNNQPSGAATTVAPQSASLPWSNAAPAMEPNPLLSSGTMSGGSGAATAAAGNRSVMPPFVAPKLANMPVPGGGNLMTNNASRAETSTRAVYLERLKALGFNATVANEALIRSDMDWDKTLAILSNGSGASVMENPANTGNSYPGGFGAGNTFPNNNNPQARPNVLALEQTLQALINQEKNIISYTSQTKTRIQEQAQRILFVSRTPAAAQNPHLIQPLQAELTQLQQQYNKLCTMLIEARTKMNSVRQRILQAQAEGSPIPGQPTVSRPLAAPPTGTNNSAAAAPPGVTNYGITLPPNASTLGLQQPPQQPSNSTSQFPNAPMYSAQGMRLPPGSGGAPPNPAQLPQRAFLPPNMTDPIVSYAANMPPPANFPMGSSSFGGQFPAGGAGGGSLLPPTMSAVSAPYPGPGTPTGGMPSATWAPNTSISSMDAFFSQMEEMKLSSQNANNNLSDIPEFVPGQRWSGLKDDSTPGLASGRGIFAVKTDHLERLAHSPVDNDAMSPLHSTRLGGGGVPMVNGNTGNPGNAMGSLWIVISDFPASNYAGVEHFRQQLQMQVLKTCGGNAPMESSIRCHWHPLQRWLLLSVSEPTEAAHVQALVPLLQSQLMGSSRVEIVGEKQARQYYQQLKSLESGGGGVGVGATVAVTGIPPNAPPRPMLASGQAAAAQTAHHHFPPNINNSAVTNNNVGLQPAPPAQYNAPAGYFPYSHAL